jgi:hypothetical protein
MVPGCAPFALACCAPAKVRAIGAAAIGILILLILASCNVQGFFPPFLGQGTARSNLSDTIGAAEAATFQLAIAKSAGFEFVILYSTAGFNSMEAHVVVMSPTLTVLNTYTLADMSAIPFVFSGSSVFAHLSDGHIVIGNFNGIAGSAGLALSALPPVVQLDNWSIIGSTTMNAYAWSGFSIDPTNVMSYKAFKADWTPSAVPILTRVVRPVDASHGQLSLDGVFTNPEDDHGNASLFVFRESGGDTDYFIQVPKTPDVEAAPATPIFASNYPTISKRYLDSRSIAVTLDSIVAYDDSAASWIRFTPSAPDSVTSLYDSSRSGNEKTAFSFSGGYYCVWDPDTRILTRYEDWW